MAGLRFAGDVRVEKVVVKTLRGLTQNITAQVIGIQIFEDLLSPFITGTIVVDDTLDLMNLFPFIGEELLELKLSTPTMEINGSIDKTFYITKMTDRQLVGDKRVVYQLHFTTIEAVLDLNKALSKTFNGLVSDIVATLLTDKKIGLQLSASDVVIEPTSNRTKYISNFWSPIKNIIYLTSQAINTSNKSPSYMFFQNRDGYNFVSLDALYKTAPIQEFVKDNYSRDDRGSGSVQNAEKDYKRITKDKYFSGFYIISAVNHFIDGTQHECTMELIKDSLVMDLNEGAK